jgi:hypothetical protein
LDRLNTTAKDGLQFVIRNVSPNSSHDLNKRDLTGNLSSDQVVFSSGDRRFDCVLGLPHPDTLLIKEN